MKSCRRIQLYFLCISKYNIALIIDCSCKYEKNNCNIWKIISTLIGGILILSTRLNIHFLLRRKKKSETVLEIPHEQAEGQYYEIEPIDDSSASVQGDINSAQESVTTFGRSASQGTNSSMSSFQNKSSSESPVQSISNNLPNEGGYENPYQTINPENIEMHPYSIVTSQMYQNTIIFPKETSARKS